LEGASGSSPAVPPPPPDFAPDLPFALFPEGETARLLTQPAAILEATTVEAIAPALAEARRLLAQGLHLAGGLAYEAGAAFEPRLAAPSLPVGPLLWLAAFASEVRVPLRQVLPEDRLASIGPLSPRISASAHAAAVERIRAHIAAGDIYQANLTFTADVAVAGHPLALFRALLDRAPAPHAALIHTGRQWWLSLSPELFFAANGRALSARPMKGTAPRGLSAEADAAAAEALAEDPKNRAENLMITDLIRNDLARVSRPGSVRVTDLFTISPQAYVHQMTSGVTATLDAGKDALDALACLFPCGSITGAPKIRAVDILGRTEWGPRGLYCGAIGWLSGSRASFNVAIRTLVMESATAGTATLGLGSGIVWDSLPADEWTECLAKARFLKRQSPLSLIETMRREPDGSIPRLALHLDRLERSARRFAFPLDRAGLERRLAALPRAPVPQRLRLLLARSGALALQRGPAPATGPMMVGFAPLPVPADDWRLAHKSGDRRFYDEARASAGTAEVLLVRPDGLLTEGSFTSIFVEKGGRLLTPPLHLGLLPGVLRAALIAEGRAEEAPLDTAAAAAASREGRLFLGNSLRGLFPATLSPLALPAARP
jgi:para-aminobenzoate synthetase/4-amino-4-deoxychorismate lyase